MKTRLTRLFVEFLESEQASGVILIPCTLASIALANSVFGSDYLALWHAKVGPQALGLHLSIEHWVNDGLMAVFFLLIGLEIEREIKAGELSDLRNASLPVIAALGGMIVPALIYVLWNRGTDTLQGFGIPMATDIAFALGVLALLGSRIPVSLKIFLTALAIIDDLGAIAVIALFYAGDLSMPNLALALAAFACAFIPNRLGVRRLWVYLVPGVLMWYFMLKSGIHATVAGVLLAFAIPYEGDSEDSPSFQLQHLLHKPVAFVILPLFALANTGIVLQSDVVAGLATASSLGIITGLVVGKPLGIALFSLVAIRIGWSQLPRDVTWRHIAGAGLLGGIGFTMSIFITVLAFDDPRIVETSKVAILLSSVVAGILGYLVLRRSSAVAEQAATAAE